MKKENKKPNILTRHQRMMLDMDWRIFSKNELPAEKKLTGKVVIISGGDTLIGRAVAVKFAAHGAKIIILYQNEREEVFKTAGYIEALTGTGCLAINCTIMQEENCVEALESIVREYQCIDIMVNNAGAPSTSESIEDITNAELQQIFRENVFPMFYLSKAALPYMKKGSSIINAASVTSYCEIDIDYSATQGVIVAFTRSLSASLSRKGIRVNGIAPGTCTPFIPSSYEIEIVEEYGVDRGLKLLGKSQEIISCYLYLASDDSSEVTGQFIYPNGMEKISIAKN